MAKLQQASEKTGIGKKERKRVLVVAALWIITLLHGGILKSIGVLLPVIKVQFETHTSTVGIVVSFVKMSGNIMGIFAQALTQTLHPHSIIIICGVLSSSGLLIISVSPNVPVLFVGSFLTGFIAVADTLALALIPSYFSKYYNTATNIITTGLPSAVIVFAPLTQFFINSYGWRGTAMLLAGLCFHCVASGTLLKPVKDDQITYKHLQYYGPVGDDSYELKPSDYEPIPDNNNTKSTDTNKQFLKDIFKISLFTNIQFLFLLIIQLLSGYTFNGWVVYFVSFALGKGQTPTSAANVPLFSGIAVFIIRGALAMISDPPSARCLLYIGAILETLSFVVIYFATNFWALSTGSFIFGLGYGIVGSQIYIAVIDIIPKDELVGAISYMQLLHGFGYLASGYITGWLYDQTGSYGYSLLVHCAVCLMLVVTLAAIDLRNYVMRRMAGHYIR